MRGQKETTLSWPANPTSGGGEPAQATWSGRVSHAFSVSRKMNGVAQIWHPLVLANGGPKNHGYEQTHIMVISDIFDFDCWSLMVFDGCWWLLIFNMFNGYWWYGPRHPKLLVINGYWWLSLPHVSLPPHLSKWQQGYWWLLPIMDGSCQVSANID